MPRLYLRMAPDAGFVVEEMRSIGVGPDGVEIMHLKARHLIFMVRSLDPRAANILKQEMLAVGGEAAMAYHAIFDMTKKTDVLLTGTVRQLSIAGEKLKKQPFGLKQLASDLEHAIDSVSKSRARTLACGKKKLKLGEKTLVMGILNVTPDSFSDGGKFFKPAIAVKHAVQMEKDGADIIDIGGESTKPGARPVSQKEEEKRVLPVIEELAGELNIPISIDTRKPEVARKAVDAGASMVNVVGGVRSSAMAQAVGELGVAVILMHMQGEPGTMQKSPKYKDVMDDIVDELACQIALCLGHGVKKSQLIVDPGIGFGKTVGHNLEIIRRLGELKILDAPIMIGTSRKSFIGKVLGLEADQRLAGSLASAVLAAASGADIVRAHDVMETVHALAIADRINQSAYQKY